ncbi:MAG: hypothetical protein R2720_01850 [Candidatus Nanopelagicales bacterium]
MTLHWHGVDVRMPPNRWQAHSSPTTPGAGMDHRRNLPHASQGLVANLMCAGADTRFVVGGDRDDYPE